MKLKDNQQQFISDLKTKIEEQQKQIENLQVQVALLSCVKIYDV